MGWKERIRAVGGGGLRLVLERTLSEDGEKTSMFDRAVHGSE